MGSKRLETKFIGFLRALFVPALILLALSWSVVYANECIDFFAAKTREQIASDLADKVYQKLYRKESFMDVFKAYITAEIDVFMITYFHLPKEQQDQIEFVLKRLSNAKSFRDYIFNLLKDTQTGSREEIQKILIQNLEEKGFKFESSNVMHSGDFFEKMQSGIVILEKDKFLLGASGHGHDTHLIQLDYIAKEFDKHFGSGKFLEFYKFMGHDRYMWSKSFDDPDSTSVGIGSPKVLTQSVFPIINLK